MEESETGNPKFNLNFTERKKGKKNEEKKKEAFKNSKVEQAIDSIFVDLNEACDNLLKDKTIEDIMNISK